MTIKQYCDKCDKEVKVLKRIVSYNEKPPLSGSHDEEFEYCKVCYDEALEFLRKKKKEKTRCIYDYGKG